MKKKTKELFQLWGDQDNKDNKDNIKANIEDELRDTILNQERDIIKENI